MLLPGQCGFHRLQGAVATEQARTGGCQSRRWLFKGARRFHFHQRNRR
jgi:hypothetical protein